MLYTTLLYIHSWWRYVVVILVLIAMVKAFSGWQKRKRYEKGDDKIILWAFIATHIQLLLGIGLYITSPTITSAFSNIGEAMRNTGLRFWLVEHTFGMIISVGLITFGRIRSKKVEDNFRKYKLIAITYLAAFIIMLITAPWPFMMVSRPWFRF
jgi:hypothetical protein